MRTQFEQLEARQLLSVAQVQDFGETISRLVADADADGGAYVRTFSQSPDGFKVFEKVWHSDGRPGSPAVLLDQSAGSYRQGQVISSAYPSMATLDGRLFFLKFGELWTSDGTAAGTVRLADLPVQITLTSDIASFFPHDGTMYVVTDTGRLWRSDGTPGGTAEVAALDPAPVFPSNPTAVFAPGADGVFYFARGEGGLTQTLWQSDGTAAGTRELLLLNPRDPITGNAPGTDLRAAGSQVYYVASDAATAAQRLWAVPAGGGGPAALVFDPGDGSAVSGLTAFGSDLLFTVWRPPTTPGLSGRIELWRTDGTPQGTALAMPSGPGLPEPQPQAIHVAGGRVIFQGWTPDLGFEPWAADANGSPATLLRDIHTGTASSTPESFTDAGGQVYFAAQGDDAARRLWRTDGTPAGTASVSAIAEPWVTAIEPWPMAANGTGTELFVANGAGTLWRVDALPDVARSLGQFGTVNGRRNVRLALDRPGGARLTATLSGPGAGEVFAVGDELRVQTTGTSPMSALKLASRRGRTAVADVRVDGDLKTLTAKAVDLDGGAMEIAGHVKTLQLARVSFATVAVASTVGTFRAEQLTGARVFSGAALGADHRWGGLGAEGDSFGAGTFGTVRITGDVTGSVVIAGADVQGDPLISPPRSFHVPSAIRNLSVGGDATGATSFAAAELPRRVTIHGRRIAPDDPRLIDAAQ